MSTSPMSHSRCILERYSVSLTLQIPHNTLLLHSQSICHLSATDLWYCYLIKALKRKKENKTKLNAQNERNKSTKQKPNTLEKVWLLWVSFTDKWRLDEWAHSSLKDSTFSFCGEEKKKEKRHIIRSVSICCIRLFFWSYQTLSDITSSVSSLMWQHNTAWQNLKGGDCFRCVLFRNTIFSWVPVFEIVPDWRRLTLLEDADIFAVLTGRCSS